MPPPRARGARRRDRRRPPNIPRSPVRGAARAGREIAAAAGVPPYVIFHDSTLRDMAEASPATLQQLSQVSGVGAAKLERYGEAFLEVIEAHLEPQP